MKPQQYDIDCAIAVKELVDKDIRKRYTDAGLSQLYGIGKARLRQAFKHLFHVSINAYQEDKRTKKAIEMLQTGNSSKDISITLGYTSSGSFGRAFKKRFGITPIQYQKDKPQFFENFNINPTMKEAFNYLQKLHPLSPELVEHLSKVFKSRIYKKNNFLLRAGQVCNKAWFLNSGIVRWFHFKNDIETTNWFVTAGNAMLKPDSFYGQIPSLESIQAIEDCETIYIEYNDLLYVYDHFPETLIMGRKVSDEYNEQLRQYADAMRMPRPEDRYRYLQTQFPDLIYTVEVPYLASFINVDESTLYKIRKRHKG